MVVPGSDNGFVQQQPATDYRLKLLAPALKYADALGLTPMARERR